MEQLQRIKGASPREREPSARTKVKSYIICSRRQGAVENWCVCPWTLKLHL